MASAASVPAWEPDPALAGWPPPPAPAERNRGAVIVAVTLGVVLLVACSVGAGSYFLSRSPKTAASSPDIAAPQSPTADGVASSSANAAAIESEEPAQQGPQASTLPADDINDLNRVCDDNVYFPESPKRAGKAPHPLVLLVADGIGIGGRYQDSTYYFSQGISNTVEQSWASDDPKNVQLVACLDRVSTGAKIRSCKFDDPKPETVTLLRANWRLRAYEVATGHELLDKPMAGDDQACPYVALFSADKKIYAKVSDRAVVAALRNLVNK